MAIRIGRLLLRLRAATLLLLILRLSRHHPLTWPSPGTPRKVPPTAAPQGGRHSFGFKRAPYYRCCCTAFKPADGSTLRYNLDDIRHASSPVIVGEPG